MLSLTDIRSRIGTLLAKIAPGYDASKPDVVDLAGQGLDSVGMVELLAALEDDFGITIPPADVRPENFRSRDSLAEMMMALLARHDS